MLGLWADDSFVRCSASGVNFLHLAWGCTAVRVYWEEVFAALSSMTDTSIEHCPTMALFGYTANTAQSLRKLVSIALLMARRRVAMLWCGRPALSTRQRLLDLTYYVDNMETYYTTLPVTSRPREIWEPFRTYLSDGNH